MLSGFFGVYFNPLYNQVNQLTRSDSGETDFVIRHRYKIKDAFLIYNQIRILFAKNFCNKHIPFPDLVPLTNWKNL